MTLDTKFIATQLISAAATLTVAGPGAVGVDEVVIPSTVTTTFAITLYPGSNQYAGNQYLREQNPGAPNSGGLIRFWNKSNVPITITPDATIPDVIYGPSQVPAGGWLEIHSQGDGNWFSMSGSAPNSGGVQTIVKALTAAQVKALNTTPIALVPAQGAGTLIVVDHVLGKIVFGTVAYTGANAVEVRYTDGSGVKAAADLTSAWLDTASGTSVYESIGASGVGVLNAAVVVAVPTANPAAGDSIVTFTVQYRVFTP